MPNHITNCLEVIGSEEARKLVFSFVEVDKKKEDDDVLGEGTIDFNKITPMPPWVYQGNLGRAEEEKYGAENCWYNWSTKNWGTKWNAYNQKDYRTTSEALYFTTAWSAPIELIRKLSWIFPTVEIKLSWADEDYGHNVGKITFKDGIVVDEDIPDGGSKEAYAMFFEITQQTPQDYGLDENFNYIEGKED